MAGATGLPLANNFNGLSEVRHYIRPLRMLGSPKLLSHLFPKKTARRTAFHSVAAQSPKPYITGIEL